MQTLKFGLDEFEPVTPEISEDYEEAKQSRFAKVKIRLFGDGANAHTEPVDFETLKRLGFNPTDDGSLGSSMFALILRAFKTFLIRFIDSISGEM